ncbi:MAG: IS1 family transposase [Desulfosarcina sp.]|nr:IS1 family transposase [Desulfobacterales bacterium]
MKELDKCFCPNKQCKDYGLRGQGNIAVRGKYGKDKSRDLLYCRTCGKRFASSRASAMFGLHLPAETIRQIIHHAAEGVGVRATARLLGLDKDTVNRVILRAGEHCARVLSSLLTSLELHETQLDELWTFVKKRNVLAAKRTLSASTDKPGSGRP